MAGTNGRSRRRRTEVNIRTQDNARRKNKGRAEEEDEITPFLAGYACVGFSSDLRLMSWDMQSH